MLYAHQNQSTILTFWQTRNNPALPTPGSQALIKEGIIKEQMRHEVAECITLETKNYADSIKEQVSQRINELKQNMDIAAKQLKTQLREQKQNFDQDLKYYQEQVSKANEKLASDVN